MSKPANATRWLGHQAGIPHGVELAALQFHLDMTLINNKDAAAHPVRLSLLNMGYASRSILWCKALYNMLEETSGEAYRPSPPC